MTACVLKYKKNRIVGRNIKNIEELPKIKVYRKEMPSIRPSVYVTEFGIQKIFKMTPKTNVKRLRRGRV